MASSCEKLGGGLVVECGHALIIDVFGAGAHMNYFVRRFPLSKRTGTREAQVTLALIAAPIPNSRRHPSDWSTSKAGAPASSGRGSLCCRRSVEDVMGYEEAKQRGRAAMALLAECCKRNDENGATELLNETLPLLHVVYQAEVVRLYVPLHKRGDSPSM